MSRTEGQHAPTLAVASPARFLYDEMLVDRRLLLSFQKFIKSENGKMCFSCALASINSAIIYLEQVEQAENIYKGTIDGSTQPACTTGKQF